MANRLPGMNEINNKYPFHVWVTSICISPVLLILYLSVKPTGSNFVSAEILFVLYAVFFGFLLSLPSPGVYYLAFHKLSRLAFSDLLLKLMLCAVAIVCLMITFYLISFNGIFLNAYITGILIPGLFFRRKTNL